MYQFWKFTSEAYNDLIQKKFSKDDVIFTPLEVFNNFIFEDDNELQSVSAINIITKIVEQNVGFISIDPKRLTSMIIKTKSEAVIKTFLNSLFSRHKINRWNSYDTTLAISYLILRGFQHNDLLRVISERCPQLYRYYTLFCHQKCTSIQPNDNAVYIRNIAHDDNSCTTFISCMLQH